ncbi:DUF6630 family protein [Nocardia higoensis]|uniref:DUF6630 family protein n=1 Tax=Nocardia higoensis TaxID=228599 RepID=UPI0012F6F166|nr:hypothetical protein [Nocardia higoensis]
MSVGDEQRAALFAIIDLWAVYRDRSHESMTYSLEHPDPRGFCPDSALVDALREDGLIYCECRITPPQIRMYLEGLPATPPALTWDWFTWTNDDAWDYDDIQEFVGPLAEECLALDTAVVGVDVEGDGFTLGFIEADRVDQLLSLAAKAGAKIVVHHARSTS